MNILFIAAGMGKRLAPYTDNCPKCMLEFKNSNILNYNAVNFEQLGATEIGIIVGYEKDKIVLKNSLRFDNTNYQNNNILFSLMYASELFEKSIRDKKDLIISYSDIIYKKEIIARLLDSSYDFSIVVDQDYEDSYIGRTDHPLSEAEKVIFDSHLNVLKLGKNLDKEIQSSMGEFIGLLKLSPSAQTAWLSHFKKLKTSLLDTDSFHGTEFQKSYLTHFIQDMIDSGTNFRCVLINGGWMEFDTPQDYEKLLKNEESY